MMFLRDLPTGNTKPKESNAHNLKMKEAVYTMMIILSKKSITMMCKGLQQQVMRMPTSGIRTTIIILQD